MEGLPRQASAMSAISEQDARQQQLEQLYLEDGRHDPEHPQHGHFTGLFIAHQQDLPDGVA